MARDNHPLRGVLLTTPWLLHLLFADVLLSLLLPISWLDQTLAYNLSSQIAASVWYGVQFIFTRINGADITISGAELPPGESAIVVANHVSWTDFYMIQALAIRSGMLGRSRYFAKQQLKWVPFLGWGLWAMGMPLVSRNWIKDKAELDSIFGRIRRNKWPTWLISYSEGTRFTQKKYLEAVEWCKANSKSIPKHVLYPRTRGFIAQVRELRQSSHVKAVYDCTISYAKGPSFQQAPSMWETLSAPRLNEKYQFYVHVERYPLADLPVDDEKLASWLEDRWIEKGERLEEWRNQHARTGKMIDTQ